YGTFFLHKIGSIISIVDLPTTNIIEPKKKPAGRPSLISTRKLDRRNSPQLPQTIFRTISDMSNTYRVNFMVGVIVPPNNIKQSMKAHLNFKTFL
ncbi:hypothetical protein OLG32_09850, partial [Streptococcus pneumoniae]|nr:hypothetical protein [Streptococcus pneumoniae]